MHVGLSDLRRVRPNSAQTLPKLLSFVLSLDSLSGLSRLMHLCRRQLQVGLADDVVSVKYQSRFAKN